MRGVAALAAGVIAATSQVASAQPRATLAVDLPAGSAGRQVLGLGALAGASIVVADRAIWNRRVPALRGRMALRAALRRIADVADADIVDLGDASFRLVARASPRRPALRSSPPVRRSPLPPAPAPTTAADLVVTASKRDVPQRDFPGRVSWVTGAELDLGGAGGTDRLVGRLTSIASTYLGAGRNKLFIRGIADSSVAGPTQPTVGQYLGDLRLNYTGPDPDLRLIDLAGVEVLEGPQGTLYGAGSLGGLIRLVPRPPRLDTIHGMVAVGTSATRRGGAGADAQGVLDLPLVAGRIGLRMAGIAEREGGYIDKPLLGRRNANGTRIAGGRATLRVVPAGGWTVDLIGTGQSIRAFDSQYAERTAGRLVNAAPVVEGARSSYAQAQVVVSGMLGDIHLRSSTGIMAQDLTERYDATRPDGPARLFAQAARGRMIANETRLWRSGADGAGWVVGTSMVHNRARLTRLSGPPGALDATIGAINRASEATVYGEASRRIRPRLVATGGLRASYTEQAGRLEGEPEPRDPDEPVAVGAGRPLLDTRLVLLPSASLLLDLTPRIGAFVRYQQGFRPGGVAIAGDRLGRFRGDGVRTVEAGVRTAGPSSAPAGFAIVVARTRWHDIQADFLDRSGLPSTANIGDGEIWTLEASGDLRVARGLRLTGSVLLNDSVIALPSRAAFAQLTARLAQIPNVARATGRLGATFERSLSPRLVLAVDAWMRYVGVSSLGFGPVLGQSQGDYVDGSIVARLGAGRLGLTLGLTNPLNVRSNRFAFGTPGLTGREQVTPLRPRTIRIGLDASF